MKPAVEAALAELRSGLPGHTVRHLEDADGGAHVIVDGLFIGENFTPNTAWIGFHITWSYPDADVYPHFMDPNVKYVGSQETRQYPEGNVPAPMSRGGKMPGFELDATQISRVSRHRNPQTETALHKLLRVLDCLRSK